MTTENDNASIDGMPLDDLRRFALHLLADIEQYQGLLFDARKALVDMTRDRDGWQAKALQRGKVVALALENEAEIVRLRKVEAAANDLLMAGSARAVVAFIALAEVVGVINAERATNET